MTVRYVDGTDGNDANDGLAAVAGGGHGPKKTLNGCEDTPVAAGDLVHVRAGTYRELLTVDVSGTAGNIIEYRGDYTGAIWTSSGGVVRVTGSNDDKTLTRNNTITATSKNYRTFTGFRLDNTASHTISLTGCTYFTIQTCYLDNPISTNGHCISGDSACTNITVQNCFLTLFGSALHTIYFGTTAADNCGHAISNCICVLGGAASQRGIYMYGPGNAVVKNCLIYGGAVGIQSRGLNAGQTTTVNNCILVGSSTGMQSDDTAKLTEDYNNFCGCTTSRNTVNVGAHSLAYPALFDARWFFQLVNAAAANQVITPWDLASYSQIVNVAGTSPTTTDMRGTSAIGGQREWGALEFDSSLKIAGGGGGVPMSRVFSGF